MVDNNSIFLASLTEQLGSAPVAVQVGIFVVPLLIIGLIVFAILKKKKGGAKATPAAAIVPAATPVAKAEEKAIVKTAEKKPDETGSAPVTVAEKAAGEPHAANILIIEDDNIMLLAIRSILAKSGYNLITAKDGKEAFEKLDTEEYDVVVTDLMMPYANGLEVVAKIRNDMSKRHVSIIVCSSVGNEETITEAFRLGADDYLKKPIKAEELLQRVRKLLDRRVNNPRLVTKKTTRANV